VKRTIYALCLIAAIATVIAGCGDSGDTSSASGEGSGGSSGQQVSSPEAIAVAAISTEKVGDLGKVLVDSKGRTVYVFHKDKRSLYSAKGSACYGACAEAWPPLLTGGEPEAEKGASPTKLSTLTRKDGTLQVTYYGHPVYTYAEDKKPGEANGNGVTAFGGQWSALGPYNEEPGG
jgi:predicted lipoprotein with Yx(FWY)xxD motif